MSVEWCEQAFKLCEVQIRRLPRTENMPTFAPTNLNENMKKCLFSVMLIFISAMLSANTKENVADYDMELYVLESGEFFTKGVYHDFSWVY